MKIAIDISSVIYGTGVSVYTKNLVENLLKVDKKNEYVLFGGSLRRLNELKMALHNHHTTVRGSYVSRFYLIPPTLADIIWNKFHIFPIERLIGRVDVFHSSDWTQPPSAAFKVTTIHDLSPLLFPDQTDPKIIKTHNTRLRWVKKEVDRVIVPTKTTGEDVINLGIDTKKVRVIPEAIEPGMKRVKDKEIQDLKAKYKIPGDYLLAVGVNRRKNTPNIIKAFKKLKSDIDLSLVIIGHRHADFGNTDGVIFLGHVPNSDLSTFYSGAKALVYPSLYEGFGLPILYAYACGTPVVTSNLGSMKEVSGEASILVDPNKVDAIAEGIKSAIKNKEKLVKLGLEEAKKYSWEKTAKETLGVYQERK